MDASKLLLAAFEDPKVQEIMLNPGGEVYVERAGAGFDKLPFEVSATDAAAFLFEIAGPDAVIGPERPCLDLSAKDGSRVHVVAAPVVPTGLCVTIRKRPTRRPTLEEMVRSGTLSPVCAGFLRYCVELRKNLLIVGGTSSGKTTLLNALAAQGGPKQRYLVLEDTQELSIPHPHVVYMKTRLGAAGLPDVSLRDLVVNSLRMRPDRVIVGEVRSVEAAELLQAMNVGQEGTMATLHANSAREALARLETLVLFAGAHLPLPAIRGYMANALDLIVFMTRLPDGSRRVTQVSEVTGIQADVVTMADIFLLEQRKAGVPALKPTGAVPRFYDQLRLQGLNPPTDVFRVVP